MEMPDDQRNAFLKDKTACILSDDLAQKLNFKLGDRVILQGDIYPGHFESHSARDLFRSGCAEFAVLQYGLLAGCPALGGGATLDSTVAILADSPEDVPRIAKHIDDMFDESPPPTKTESEQQFALSFVSLLGNIKLFLLSICAAVTFTILLVSGNTMAMSVRERIKEVGVLKTLGFTNDTILGMIIVEALTIASSAG